VEKLLDAERSLIKEAAQELSQQKVEELRNGTTTQSWSVPSDSSIHFGTAETASATSTSDQSTPTEKRYEHYKEVKLLHQQGHTIRAITRHLGVSRNTVRRYLRQESFAPKTKVRRSNALKYEDYLRKRWAEGENCVYTLYKEIKAMGYNGSYPRLTVFMSTYPRAPLAPALPPAQKGAHYSTRSLSIAFCQQEDEWEEDHKPLLNKLLQKSDLLRQARTLSLEFKTMMEQKNGRNLEDWCQKASQLNSFKGFVRGIRQDFQAVQQALSSSWSNGQIGPMMRSIRSMKGRSTDSKI
jgi:transposase